MKRVGHLDLPGGGQVIVEGSYAYVGHMRPPHGTTILDISDPASPRVLSEIALDDALSHSHKVRVVGDLMYTNVEQNNRRIMRRASRIPEVRVDLERKLGRAPVDAELAMALDVKVSDLPALEGYRRDGYHDGGFKIWDISDRAKPRLLVHQRTGGVGVHRFDVDSRYAYISTEMEGFVGNILVIYDIHDPGRPEPIAKWWMPGQHVAAGETPTWRGQDWRLHHTLRHADKLYAGCWQGGMRVIDVSDIAKPRTVGAYNYHPLYREPTHTVMRVPFPLAGRNIALVVDEQHDHHDRGQPRACLWTFDVGNLDDIHPVGQFHVSELDSPFARTKGRFGAHQFQEHLDGSVVFCTWFAGGVRAVDIRDPQAPEEIGWYIPEPRGGFPSPQSNDVEVDSRGLVYLLDRNLGLDIIELQR
jgi:hypothetical protein